MAQNQLTTMTAQEDSGIHTECDHNVFVMKQDPSPSVLEILDRLSQETKKEYYGPGLIIPENITGARILDIGSGSGSLVFVLSKLVGPTGYVVGVDISTELIETCTKERAQVAKLWGYDKPNVEFHVGNAERLLELTLGQFDVVVSVGVFCLVRDKEKALSNVFAMLKEGGQFFLRDVYAQTEIEKHLINNETLWAGGISGSMLWSTLKDVAVRTGFTCPHLYSVVGRVNVQGEYKKMTNKAQYACAAWRLFKLPGGAKRGAATVTYLGNINDNSDCLPWDVDLTFRKGEAVNVDGDLATILANTCFNNNFRIQDCEEQTRTNRHQDPFARLAEYEAQNQPRGYVYTVE